MTTQEFKRLMGYHNAKRNKPYANHIGRSFAKGRAAGYGQILKSSWVKSTVPIEKIFLQFK